MKVFTSRRTGELGKFECVVESFAHAFQGSVLDVGSRTGNLRQLLNTGVTRYVGLDLAPPATVVGNLEAGLPFADRSFQTVLALDVLEHTDQIHAAVRELLRVASSHVIVALPNAFDVKGRLRVLSGRHVSGKYGLPVEPRHDRHRWFFGFSEAHRFCSAAADRQGWVVHEYGALVGPLRGRCAALVRHSPDLLAPSYVGWLRRAGSGKDVANGLRQQDSSE